MSQPTPDDAAIRQQVMDGIAKVGQVICRQATEYLQQRGETPSPLLETVCQVQAMAGMLATAGKSPEEIDAMLDPFLKPGPEQSEEELNRALDQLSRAKSVMRGKPTPAELKAPPQQS
ncbi:MAG: hypothetical protein QM770_22735 [Tepidisphaeraceae bacterium]